jgi:hypothetical protein
MAVRAAEQLQYTEIRAFTVATAPVTAGQAVKQSADLIVPIAGRHGDSRSASSIDDAAVGAICRVAMFGTGIKKVKVGTGGATRGSAAKYVANGLTNGDDRRRNDRDLLLRSVPRERRRWRSRRPKHRLPRRASALGLEGFTNMTIHYSQEAVKTQRTEKGLGYDRFRKALARSRTRRMIRSSSTSGASRTPKS